MWGTHNDSDKDGLTELKLSDKTYDNVNYILFADNSRQDNAIHRSSFSLDKTNLTLSRGILFRNASNSIWDKQSMMDSALSAQPKFVVISNRTR